MMLNVKYKTITVSLADLAVNKDNYRYRGNNYSGQREAIDWFVDSMSSKILVLAESILENGLSPFDLILATNNPNYNNQSGENDSQYVVLEGNRRTTTLKLLDNPSLSNDKNLQKKLKDLKKKYDDSILDNILDSLQIIYTSDLEYADYFITLKHTGENNGEGVISWSSFEKDKLRKKSGRSLYPDVHIILKYMEDRGLLPDNVKVSSDIDWSSANRIFASKQAKDGIGYEIDLENESIKFHSDKEQIERAFLKIIGDLLNKEIHSRKQIQGVKDRETYVKKIIKNNSIEVHERSNKPEVVETNVGLNLDTNKKKSKGNVDPLSRKTLIPPRGCNVSISSDESKILHLFNELKKIQIDDAQLSVGVMFRVFTEFSVKRLCELSGTKLTKKGRNGDENTQKNLQELIDDAQKLLKENLGEADIRTLRKFSNKTESISVTRLNDYVHNHKTAIPQASDLKTSWDELHNFFTTLWNKINRIKAGQVDEALIQ